MMRVVQRRRMGNYTGLFERRLWHGRTTKVVLAVLVDVMDVMDVMDIMGIMDF